MAIKKVVIKFNSPKSTSEINKFLNDLSKRLKPLTNSDEVEWNITFKSK